MLRPFLEEYVSNRMNEELYVMRNHTLHGNTTDAITHAARHQLFESILKDMEHYRAQEQTMRSIPFNS